MSQAVKILSSMMRDQAWASLGDRGGVLVVDETGLPKKGVLSVGLALQYS